MYIPDKLDEMSFGIFEAVCWRYCQSLYNFDIWQAVLGVFSNQQV